MRFSQRTESAIKALMELGRRHGQGPTPCHKVAEAQRIPARLCEQAIHDLRQAGFVVSHRGASGGTELAREPSSITMSEVVDAVEGPVVTQACLDPFDDDARLAAHSATQELWLDLQITIRDRLASVTLADLVARQDELDRSSALVFQI